MQDSPKISVDVANFHRAAAPLELQRIAGGPYVTVMLLPRQLTKTLIDNVLTSHSAPPPLYLTGPGGVGKSSILFMTAAAVLHHNDELLRHRDQQRAAASSDLRPPILLLYVANAGELIELSSEEAAAELCKVLKSLNLRRMGEFTKVLEVLDNESLSNLERWNQFCLKLRETRVRNLILVDQWNAIIRASPTSDHPLRRFRAIGAKIGFSKFVAAVSSSYGPIDYADRGVFRDAEAESAKCRIEPLNLEDMMALRDIWRVRYAPVEVDDTTLSALHECTGGIPRLLESFAATRSLNSSATIDDPEWRHHCTDYYVGRMKIISRNLSDSDIRKCFHGELASLFLRNRELLNADSDFASHWLTSGLLVPDDSRQFLVPVNLFVRKAIDAYVSSEQTMLLRNMYADKATEWRALELFFFLQLRKGRATLTGTDLRGTDRMVLQFDHHQLEIIDVNQDFASDPQGYLDRHNGGKPFRAGTMLIPTWANHPVADPVMFVNVESYSQPQIIFVQFSTSSYADHRSKIPNLHPMVPNQWKLSVLQSYQIAFGITDKPNRDIAKGKLLPNVKYVFATTNKAVLGPSSQCSGHSVFLMRKANIKNLNEQLWLEMTQSGEYDQRS